MSLSTLVNNQAVSWNKVSISFSPGIGLPGLTLQTVKSIDYGYKLNMAKQYGQGNKPVGRTDGIVEPEDATVEMGEADWIKLLTIFGTLGGMSFLQTEASAFDITVNYQLFPIVTPDTDVLQGCRVKGIKKKPAQGPEGMMVELTLDVFDISYGAPGLNVGGVAVGL